MKRQLAFIGTVMVSIALLNCNSSEQKEKEEPKAETATEKKKEPFPSRWSRIFIQLILPRTYSMAVFTFILHTIRLRARRKMTLAVILI
ncbi:MAG: hypothetical protein WDO16_03060 [Bacteroidota bacterium]